MPQLVLLLINEQEYYCSLVSPTNNCTVTTADIDNNVNVTINISEVLEYGAIYSIAMSFFTISNVGSSNFTFNFSKYSCLI